MICRAEESRPELLVLHAVRLGGFSDTRGVAERAGLPDGILRDTLGACEHHGYVEQFAFADSRGWILTEAGKRRDAKLLHDELATPGVRPVLEKTVAEFETLNPRLVRIASMWQLRSPSDDVAEDAVVVVGELTNLAQRLEDVMADVVSRLARFGRYPRQFSAAAERARAGEHEWIAGVGKPTCHTVWAELHQDLLSSLGRKRSMDPHEEG